GRADDARAITKQQIRANPGPVRDRAKLKRRKQQRARPDPIPVALRGRTFGARTPEIIHRTGTVRPMTPIRDRALRSGRLGGSRGGRMKARVLIVLAAAVGAAAIAPGRLRGGVLDHLLGVSVQPSLGDIGRMIDRVQEKLVNQGTVVVKQPDIWSQARMTAFRREYEDTMAQELTKFQVYLNARIARSDAAALQSQTALAASLTPLAPGQTLTLPNAAAVQSELSTATSL